MTKAKKPKVVGQMSVDVTLFPPRSYLAFTEEIARLDDDRIVFQRSVVDGSMFAVVKDGGTYCVAIRDLLNELARVVDEHLETPKETS